MAHVIEHRRNKSTTVLETTFTSLDAGTTFALFAGQSKNDNFDIREIRSPLPHHT